MIFIYIKSINLVGKCPIYVNYLYKSTIFCINPVMAMFGLINQHSTVRTNTEKCIKLYFFVFRHDYLFNCDANNMHFFNFWQWYIDFSTNQRPSFQTFCLYIFKRCWIVNTLYKFHNVLYPVCKRKLRNFNFSVFPSSFILYYILVEMKCLSLLYIFIIFVVLAVADFFSSIVILLGGLSKGVLWRRGWGYYDAIVGLPLGNFFNCLGVMAVLSVTIGINKLFQNSFKQ